MGQPPGGPEDERGPGIQTTFPTADAVLVSRKMEARIRFDEAVDRKSVENALFFSPDPGDRFRLSWRGNELRIRYLDSLAEAQTYVIVVGSTAKDIRGNPIGRPITMAFSTGDHIDQGRIWGRVAGQENPQSVNLWAYELSDSMSPNPQTDAPAYRTQPGVSGLFHFSHIRSATYRVFAVKDVGLDGFWNPPVDPIGIPPCDAVVTEELQPYLSFRLSLFDTSALQIRGVTPRDERQLEVKFSRQVLAPMSFHLESLSGDTVSAFGYENPEDSISWRLYCVRPLAKGKWKLTTTVGTQDSLQIFLDTVNVRAVSDTMRPSIVKQFPVVRARLADTPDAIELYFSEAIHLRDSIAQFSLCSVRPPDTLKLAPHWFHAAHLSLASSKPLERGGDYTFVFNAAALADLSGNLLGDTVQTFTFQILPEDSLGSLSGVLTDVDDDLHVISAWSVHLGQVMRTATNVRSGEFVLENLPSGSYGLEVLRDSDGSGSFSAGNMNPWRYSEMFWMASDSFMVRPRWDRGGIQLNFSDLK
jgi:methionine-rich copper-binding protein CopC